MPKNPKDKCPLRACKKSIHTDDSHFDGVPASPETMLRCVLYQMHVLASAALALPTDWDATLRFRHPKLGEFTPSEPLRIAALISFRIMYDFLYNSSSGDDFSIGDFGPYGANRPTVPQFAGFKRGTMFTKESINKFMAHMTWARINKPHCIPQPKFSRGTKSTISNARKLLKDAKQFVDEVCDPSNPKRITLDRDGEGYRKMFEEAFVRLSGKKVT